MISEVFPRIIVDPLDLLAAGATRAEILADYPYLEDAGITAALNYAANNKIAFAAE